MSESFDGGEALIRAAEDLGAATAVLSGNDIARATVEYARSHNLSKIAMGRRHPTWPWRDAHIERIAAFAPDIDLLEIGNHRKPGQQAGDRVVRVRVALDGEALLAGRERPR